MGGGRAGVSRRAVVVLGGVIVVVGAGLAWLWWQGTDMHSDPTDRELVALGRQVYAANCASCHGAALQGETADWRTRKPSGALPAPPHDASGHTWHHSDDQLFRITKYGIAPFAPEGYVTDMPAFEEVLTDREIHAVLAYIKSRWPDDEREAQAALSGRN